VGHTDKHLSKCHAVLFPKIPYLKQADALPGQSALGKAKLAHSDPEFQGGVATVAVQGG